MSGPSRRRRRRWRLEDADDLHQLQPPRRALEEPDCRASGDAARESVRRRVGRHAHSVGLGMVCTTRHRARARRPGDLAGVFRFLIVEFHPGRRSSDAARTRGHGERSIAAGRCAAMRVADGTLAGESPDVSDKWCIAIQPHSPGSREPARRHCRRNVEGILRAFVTNNVDRKFRRPLRCHRPPSGCDSPRFSDDEGRGQGANLGHD